VEKCRNPLAGLALRS